MSLREEWERHAEEWARWAREPGHDSYWRVHREAFFSLVPPAGRLTLDVGCGEGRVARDLAGRGHRVVALDASPTLVRFAATHPDATPVLVADAAALPVAAGAADLVVAFMSLQDVDDYVGAVAEAARVLEPGGALCLAIVHPLNAAGAFTGARDDVGTPFVISGSYFAARQYADEVERRGLTMTFHSEHRTIEAYSRALEAAGFVVEALREVGDPGDPARWSRVPLFLDVRARRG